MLIRVSGVYFDKSSPLISITGELQISITVNGEGLFCLNLVLRNENDDVLLKMENIFLVTYPDYIYDIIAEPKTNNVKIWLKKADIGLEFSFHRISIPDLEGMLDTDWKRSQDEIRHKFPGLDPDQTNGLGERIKNWVNNNVVDNHGHVPLLNIEQMSLYRNGERFVVKNGIANSIMYSFFHDLVGGAINFPSWSTLT
jgi:hypothetical protein